MLDVDALSAAIEDADASRIKELYQNVGARPPELLWRPELHDFSSPELQGLLTYWNDLRGSRQCPLHRSVDPFELKPLLGFLNWIEPLNGGENFRYRIYGSRIADLAGFEMTGKRITDMPIPQYGVDLLMAGHRAILRRREPLKSIHEPTATSNTTHWTRLILPFCDESGAVTRIMVGNIPGEWRAPSDQQLPRLYPNFV